MRRTIHRASLGALVLLQEAVSIEARVEAVRSAIWRRNESALGPGEAWYPVDVLEDAVILRRGDQLFRAAYTFGADGAVQFAEPEKVEVEYTPVRVQESTLTGRLVEGASGEAASGLEWDVVIIEPGMSKNGLFYPAETLREAAPLFEGVHVYVFDDSASGHKADPSEKVQGQMAGWIDTVQAAEGGALTGRLHFLQEGVAEGARRKLVDAWQRGKRDLLGLSIDARGTSRTTQVSGRSTRLVESIRSVLSVDVVLKPAAGGRFTRLVASAAADDPQENRMKKNVKRLLRILESRRPDALAGIDRETATFGELADVATEEELREALQPESTTTTTTPPAPAATAAPGSATLQEAERIATRSMVNILLQESRLPELVQKRIQKRFEGQVAGEIQIQAAIDEEREYAGALNPARVAVPGGGGVDVRVGPAKLDRLQAALDRSFGLEPENSELRSTPPITLRRLYQELTLGHDPDVTGILSESAQQEMMQEAFTNATLDRVVANTMHRKLIKDYREVDYGERRIMTVRPGVSDFKTQEAVRIGYFGDLPAVDPESADYAELAAYADEAETYSVGQKGAIVTITRKHIINDDLGHVVKVVGRLGRAARRTFAKFVWNFILNNPNLADGTALFAVGRNNLITTALSATSLSAMEQALFKQTEPGSTERLGLSPYLLVVPIELKATAWGLNHSGVSDNDNAWRGRFGASGENILVNPLFTDANDYLITANPADVDMIEVAFLNGQEEPELFVADNPAVGQMFTADKRQYKIRHEYGGAPVDFRGLQKAVVA